MGKRRRLNNHTHTHRHSMFAATNNIVISTPTNTTSLFSSTRRHHQPSSSRRPHPFFVCASSSLKSSTRKQQEKDDRKTVVDDVDRRGVLTKAALVASVAMTTMTPKPALALFGIGGGKKSEEVRREVRGRHDGGHRASSRSFGLPDGRRRKGTVHRKDESADERVGR